MATTKKTVKKKPVAAKTATRKKTGAKNVAATLGKAGMKKATKKTKVDKEAINAISLEPLALRIAVFEIESLSPMLLQCLSAKSEKQLEEGRAGTKKKKIDYGTPESQAKDAISGYLVGGGFSKPWTKSKIEVPNSWIKKMLINVAGRHVDALKLNTAGGVFQVVESTIAVKHSGISIHQGWVKVPPKTGAPVLRFRGQLKKWSLSFSIRYNSGMIDAKALAVIIETAGFANGLGDFRPQKDGHYGQFQIKRR
jgi:hypothetical protein